ncbi:hypothetical protein EMCRGX_G033572 [Ephydatia muelleri]
MVHRCCLRKSIPSISSVVSASTTTTDVEIFAVPISSGSRASEYCTCHTSAPSHGSSVIEALAKVVSAIAADSVCSELLFHAWYLDDGVVAGPRLAVENALSIIQELGPPLGLFFNPTKCELFGLADLNSFPIEMKRLNVPHLEILGAPIGDLIFCAIIVAQKRAIALKLLNQLSDDIYQCFTECTSVDTPDNAWQQAQLSLSRGGLGLRCLSHHSSAAYIASLTASDNVSNTNHHFLQALQHYNSLVPLAEAVSVEAGLELPGHLSQRNLSSKLEDHQFRLLFQSLSLPNRARLLSASSPHASAWLQVVPAPGLNLHLDPPEFQAGIKWWLGIDSSHSANCPYCPSHCLDPLGHHALTCKYRGDVVSRHNRLRDVPAGELALVPKLKQEVILGMTNIVHDLLTCLSRTGC